MGQSRRFPSIIHWLIGVILMALGYVLPASAPLTPMGVKILMIFVGMIYLWCTVNPIGGSLLALFAVSVVGYQPMTAVLSTAVSNQTWIITFFAIILFVSAIESGMPRYVAQAIFKTTQGVVTGRPMALVFILMIAAFVLSALTDIIPVILMFWGICYTIIEELKLEKQDPYSMLLVMATFLGATLGNAALPFKGATIIIISAFEAAAGTKLNYGIYLVVYMITALIIMTLFCLGCKLLFRVDMSKVRDIDGHMLAREALEPMSTNVKAHLIAIFGFIVLILISSFLPAESAAKAWFTSVGTEGIAVLMIIFLFLFQDKDGKPIVHMKKVMGEMPWGAVFMVMAAVYMAGVLKDKEACGVIPWLKTLLTPVLGGHGELIFTILIVALAMILTCFFHNGALGNMMMPVLFAVASASGYHAVAIAAVMTMAINVAYLAPSASNWAPLLHANKEYITTKEIWTIGLFFELLCFAVYIIVGYPLASLMF